jgi:hypothetical protein
MSDHRFAGAVIAFVSLALLAGCGGPSSAEVRRTAVSLAGPMAHKTAAIMVRKTVLAMVAGVTATAGATFTLHGTLQADDCASGSNIENASVEVKNENNKLIGNTTTSLNQFGPLKPGDDTAANRAYLKAQDPARRNSLLAIMAYCKVSWAAEVQRAQRYQIKIGTHEGPVYTFDQLQKLNWHLDLNLNSSS